MGQHHPVRRRNSDSALGRARLHCRRRLRRRLNSGWPTNRTEPTLEAPPNAVSRALRVGLVKSAPLLAFLLSVSYVDSVEVESRRVVKALVMSGNWIRFWILDSLWA